MRLRDADEAVLAALERELLDPAIIDEAMHRALANVAAGRTDLDVLRAQTTHALDQTRGELDRLTAAILAGGDAGTIVAAIRERERRRDVLQRELRDLDRPAAAAQDVNRSLETLRARLVEWKALLRKHAPKARQMLRKLLDGRIVFTPDRAARRYTFTAPGTLSRFFNGLVCPQAGTSPTGTDRRWRVSGDTREAA